MGRNDQGGGGPWGSGDGGGPWAGGGGGLGGGPRRPQGGGPTPPDLEELLRKSQERVRRFMPGGAGGARGIGLLVVAIIAVWGLTGIYRVDTQEQGIRMLFGQYHSTTAPGLHIWFPAPIGQVYTPNVTQVNEVKIGFRGEVGPRGSNQHEVPAESLMLTGDQNIIDVKFVVQWLVKDAADYLFNIRDPETTVKAAAESAMREVIGQMALEKALSQEREQVDQRTQVLLQDILDSYGAGIEIQSVKMQQVDAPQAVIDAFNDVQRAKQDQERLENEANRYLNDVVPRAEGEAERMIQNATAYKERLVREAEGEAQRFLSVYNEYKVAKDVTAQRMYLERMQEILGRADKVIIDQSAKGGPGVVPYLPLPEVQKKSRAQGGQQ